MTGTRQVADTNCCCKGECPGLWVHSGSFPMAGIKPNENNFNDHQGITQFIDIAIGSFNAWAADSAKQHVFYFLGGNLLYRSSGYKMSKDRLLLKDIQPLVPIAIALDIVGQRIFYSAVNFAAAPDEYSIHVIDYDGRNYAQLLLLNPPAGGPGESLSLSFRSLAYYPPADYLYYITTDLTAGISDHIHRMNGDGTNDTTVVTDVSGGGLGDTTVGTIAVDPVGKKLFYSVRRASDAKVKSVSLAGADPAEIFTFSAATSMAVLLWRQRTDDDQSRLYVHHTSVSSVPSIDRMNRDGTDVVRVLSSPVVPPWPGGLNGSDFQFYCQP